jgi:hypothetical protein
VNTERDKLGRLVREVWIAWAKEQPNPKPSWLVPYDQMAEPDKEVDRRIGETLFRAGLDIGSATKPKPVRICADCGQPMRRYDKWRFGKDGRIRHRFCDNPEQYHAAP